MNIQNDVATCIDPSTINNEKLCRPMAQNEIKNNSNLECKILSEKSCRDNHGYQKDISSDSNNCCSETTYNC